MFRVIGRSSTVLALCLALGWHWTALQSVAWTTMLISNAASCSFGEAVKKTFDGEHPCSLCLAVRDGMAKNAPDMANNSTGSKQQPVKTSTAGKPDLFCCIRSLRLPSEYRNLSYEVRDTEVVSRRGAPSLPPPRSLLG